MVLGNGTVLTCIVRIHSGDVERIYVDKSLVGKLSAENACDGKALDCEERKYFVCFNFTVTMR